MVKLIIEDDEGKTTVVPLIREEITIGRKEGNTIRLTERNVSRRHAKLVKQNGAIFIEDLNSYNGIKVNGNRISGRVAVAEGDRIQIGDYVLGLKMEGLVDTAEHPFAASQTAKMPRQADFATAPTAEMQTPIEPSPVDSAVTEEHLALEHMARMVCLSNNFPGQEWILDKPVMVLGRTEDNDIVINHRSISRHHARVTEENGRYTIIDLQSSNGVRVNGEEYGKVELRRGDLVDLGHVRLRFVAAGEDFVFARDASVVDISRAGTSRGGLWAGLAVVIALAVGFIVWRMSSTEHPPVMPDTQPQPIGQIPLPEPTPEEGPDPAILVAKISRAVSSEQWKTAMETCQQLSGEAKASADANCSMARMEMRSLELFEKVHSAALQNKYLAVIRYHDKIPPDSVYKKRDLHLVVNARTKFLAQARKELDDLVKQNDCARAQDLAADIREVDPTDTHARIRVKDCGTGVAMEPTPPRPKQRPRPRPPKPQPKVVKPVVPSQNTLNQAQTILKQAQDAYVAGNHRRSIQLAQQVLKLVPKHTRAIQILGSSACYLKNERLAQWALDRLKPAPRALLQKICIRNGLTLQ